MDLQVQYMQENSIKHAPSECVLIFKANGKGEVQTKKQQEEFRARVREVIGDKGIHIISAIRPTRNGGHILNIGVDESLIITPKRKTAKVVCRDPLTDVSMERIFRDLYSRHNPHLQSVL